MLSGTLGAGAVMPAGTVEELGNMDLAGPLLAKISQLSVHRLGVGHAHQPSIALPSLWTAGAEQIDEIVFGLPRRPVTGIGPHLAWIECPPRVAIPAIPEMKRADSFRNQPLPESMARPARFAWADFGVENSIT